MQPKKRRKFVLALPRGELRLGERTLVMGVLNVTPDSFSDGGQFVETDKAVNHALAMERAGADLLDVGGESTRPGAAAVAAEEELRRILPVLKQLCGRLSIPVSVDTSKAEVAEAVLAQGVQLLNDITGLRGDPRLAELAARSGAALVVMHIRGTPRTMQKGPFARDLWRSLESGLQWSLERARQAGVRRNQLIVDPGIGFGKSAEQNLQILRELDRLADLRLPILVGTSRKSFIGSVLGGAGPEERLWGTAATVTAAILNGAHIVRVHDVQEMVEVARVADSIRNAAVPAAR